jgi:hypothetical protein
MVLMASMDKQVQKVQREMQVLLGPREIAVLREILVRMDDPAHSVVLLVSLVPKATREIEVSKVLSEFKAHEEPRVRMGQMGRPGLLVQLVQKEMSAQQVPEGPLVIWDPVVPKVTKATLALLGSQVRLVTEGQRGCLVTLDLQAKLASGVLSAQREILAPSVRLAEWD